MKIHILGICGTFMGSLAILAKQAGMEVSGQDLNFYPPMSTELQQQNITIDLGFEINALPKDVDIFVIGNVMSRGMPIIEYLLDHKLPILSGPEFLYKHIIHDKKVIAVSGTHGKTTTTTLITHILRSNGINPGFLIGGVPKGFDSSAYLSSSEWFVIEADEYDCAFFDKRSKFMHYHPEILVINNIEFDHADIFADLNAIIKSFHLLLRTMSSKANIIFNNDCINIKKLFEQGVWSKKTSFGKQNADLSLESLNNITLPNTLLGEHNKLNALAAILACTKQGVTIDKCTQALQSFAGVKRRLEFIAEINHIKIYSDFAHHPTAIRTTINGLVNAFDQQQKIWLIIDIGSNTMKSGHHDIELAKISKEYDNVLFYSKSNRVFDLPHVYVDHDALLENLKHNIRPYDIILIMSNTGFVTVIEQLQDLLLNYSITV